MAQASVARTADGAPLGLAVRLGVGGGALGLILVGVGLASLAVGPVAIPLASIGAIALSPLGISLEAPDPTHEAVLLHLRLPRIVVGALVGMALAVSGATMQGVFRNPLADPGVLGVSAGAALGAVVAIATGLGQRFTLGLPLCAFTGAMGAMLAVYALAWLGGRPSPTTLLLAGVAISAFLGALLSFVLMALSPYSDALRGALYWLLGGLEGRGWHHVRLAFPFILGGTGVIVGLARELNLLLLGDDQARALGVRVGVVRMLLLTLASLVTGVAVAVSGSIAFVGLVVPHALRLVFGPDNRIILPLSGLAGAAFLVLADTIARTAVAPAEVRVGVITSLVGAPFFLFLLLRMKHKGHIG
ncbi:MAG: iron ABC transporter permease [Dehalococcoidia bacterium]|nr:iron ABC transporter permease [Dehalococcoidia bacterium]MDW8119153.1 iron chelate uptake ABC transporter family permease subunit [Chloroflexota bacterium]